MENTATEKNAPKACKPEKNRLGLFHCEKNNNLITQKPKMLKDAIFHPHLLSKSVIVYYL